MDNKKATADQIENLRRQWMVLDYQSKVALAFAFNDDIEKLEESMVSQRSRDSPARPVQEGKNKTKRSKKAKTSLPTAALQGHLEELTEVPTTKDPELPAPTQRLSEGMTSTPAKKPRTTDSSHDEESFRIVQRKKKKQGTSPPRPGDPHLNLPGRPPKKDLQKEGSGRQESHPW